MNRKDNAKKRRSSLLLEVGGPSRERWTTCVENRARVGRDPCAEIHLTGRDVSRVHAAIDYCDGGWQIEDIESTNGTIVNGRSISWRPLKAGDIVSIGDWQLRIVDCEAGDPQQSPSGVTLRYSPFSENEWDNQPTLQREDEVRPHPRSK